MQKIGFVLLLIFPTFSNAASVQLANANIANVDKTTGYNLGYVGINNNQYVTTLSYSSFSEDNWRSSSFSAGFNYSFQPVNLGSFYMGVGMSSNSNKAWITPPGSNNLSIRRSVSDQSSFTRVGYTKMSLMGIAYDYSVVNMDGKTSVGASWRGAINRGFGWLFGVSSDGDDEVISTGISMIF